MADWADVERIAMSLADVEESTWFRQRAWKVKGKAFAWDRPLRKGDLEALGDAAPDGPILGLRVEHEMAKQALVESDSPYFTIPHFRNFLAVLVPLDEIDVAELTEALEEAWMAMRADAVG